MSNFTRCKPAFFQHVYTVVRMIPFGQVATYGQIAAIVSHRGAARTVGWAMRALPGDCDVPWHRVVNARGGISTGTEPDGIGLQRVLLEREGITFAPDGRLDLRSWQWPGLAWPEVEALRQEWSSTQQQSAGNTYPWRESNPRHMV